MAAVVHTSVANTVAPGLGEEQFRSPVNGAGIYQLYLDLAEMNAIDELQILLGTSINGTSTYHNTVVEHYTGAQSQGAKALVPVVTIQGMNLRLNHIAGEPAGFNIPWRLDRLGTPQYVNGGRQLTVVGTTHTLATITGISSSPYVLVPSFDFASAGPSDQFEVTIWTKPHSTSAEMPVKVEQVSGAGLATASIVQLSPIVVPYETIVTLKQVAGTAQNVDWQLVTI